MKVLLLLTLVVGTGAMNIRNKRDVSTMDDASKYLFMLGYYMDSQDFSAASTSQAILRFQKVYRLAMTGTMNEETMNKMNTPRCRNPDTNMMEDGQRRKKRYALQGSKWPKQELTYKITQYTDDLPKNEIDVYVRESFKVWSDVTPLRFYRSDSDDADILILFVYGDHGDGGPFDGEGGTYAHAYYPQYGGDAHFDDAERWTIGTSEGVNFFQVCVHEFGHSLGLLHSNVENSIMEPYYQGYRPGWRLHQDDVDGIQTIYGGRDGSTPTTTSSTTSTTTRRTTKSTTSPTTSTTTPTTSYTTPSTRRTTKSTTQSITTKPREVTTTRGIVNPGDNDACSVEKWDTVVTVRGGDTYFFAGQYYYKLSQNKEEARMARVISEDWGGMPGNIDSAVTLNGWLTVVFKGDSFYLFRGQERYDQYKRKSKYYFPNIPETMDAAWIWPGNNKLYVTKGLDYWRHDWRKQKNNYPRPFAHWWPGVPLFINAANRFTDDNLHFFVGNAYFVFDTKEDMVVGGARSVGEDFFGCENTNPDIPDVPDRVSSLSELNEMQANFIVPDDEEEIEAEMMTSFQDPTGILEETDVTDVTDSGGIKSSSLSVIMMAAVIVTFSLHL